jgi:hypothetical protein
MKFFRLISLISSLACAAASSGCSVAQVAQADATDDTIANTTLALTPPVNSVRIVQLNPSARVLQLVAANGSTVATYYPGFFRATLRVPDVQSNTAAEISKRVGATYLLAATLNPRTGVVAVAARGFLFAETSFDMVFRINTRSNAFRAAPMSSAVLDYLPFEGRRPNGVLVTDQTPTRPFIDIRQNGLSYDTSGRLSVSTASASDAEGSIVYNPDSTVASCVFVNGPPRCP